MKKFTSLLVMMFVMTAFVWSQSVLFEENFDDGIASTRWNVVNQGTSNTTNLAFDYVANTAIGTAPNGGGLGMKIIVNETEGVASQALTFPIGKTFTGEYTLSFDCWMNWTGTDGTTEFALFGIKHTDELAPNYTGIDLAVTGDGGSGSDVRLFVEGGMIDIDEADTTDVYVAGTRNFTAPPYTNLGDYAGMQWLQVDIKVITDSVYIYVNDDLWITALDTVADGGNICLGYADWFTSLAADLNNWIVYDNVVVTDNTVSVQSAEPQKLASMYPNPAYDVLTVNVDEEATFELINTVGQVVHSSMVNGRTSIEVSHLNPGMYLAKITARDGKVEVHKVMVK